MKMIAILLVALMAAGAGPATKPAIQIKPDAPKEAAVLLAVSDALKKAYLKSIPEAIRLERLDLSQLRTARITGGSGSGVKYPDDPALRSYSFGNTEDKLYAIVKKQSQIKVLEQALVDSRDPKKVALPFAMQGDLKIGFVGRIRAMEIIQIVGPDSARVKLFPAFQESYTPDGSAEAMMVNWNTAGLVDGNIVEAAKGFRISGTKTYQTALGGPRTILEIQPFSPDEWFDR